MLRISSFLMTLGAVVLLGGSPLLARGVFDPHAHAVYQRDANGQAMVPIRIDDPVANATHIEARVTPMAGYGGVATDWITLDTSVEGDLYTARMPVQTGWYTMDLRLVNGTASPRSYTWNGVGVGEVFITSGQSNAVRSGNVGMIAADPRVSEFYDLQSWRQGSDPSANQGSPWPVMGDLLAQGFDVPVAYVMTGVGGTRVSQWQPGGANYQRIQDAIEALEGNFRAILWHQGESDMASNTATAAYVRDLRNVIDASRADAGWDVPWLVAQATFIQGGYTQAQIDRVRAGQQYVIDNDLLVFQGPDTDTLGLEYRRDGVHMNAAGLQAHGTMWADAIESAGIIPEPATLSLVVLGAVAACRRRRGA